MNFEKSAFERLNFVNVNKHTEEKGGLTYLSWAWAWAEVKKVDPKATYTIYEDNNGMFYHTDGRTAWVKTGVTVDGLEHIEYLPIMDYRNNAIQLEKITSTDVNKTIQRSLTKACARHGLGLYIYAGEDLPEKRVWFDEVVGVLKERGVDVKDKDAWKPALPETCQKFDLDNLSEDGWHYIYDELTK